MNYIYNMSDIDPSEVLGKALVRASNSLGLSNGQRASLLGDLAYHFKSGDVGLRLDPQSEAGELSMNLVELSSVLCNLSGGDPKWISHFMNTPNTISGGVPIEQIMTKKGLFTVLNSLKALAEKP